MKITFDQYQRYKTIQILIKAIKNYYKLDKVKILEVGANEQLNLEKFLPDEDITYSDLEVPESIGSDVKFIKADATNLCNIDDGEFDIVVSSDVFEHIPKDKRNDFIKETYRVSKILNINCFPFYSRAVVNSEIRVNEFYKGIYGIDHRWLKEHIDNGLPNINDIEILLNRLNMKNFMFEHGDIFVWEEMTKALSFSESSHNTLEVMQRIVNVYIDYIYRHDIGNENYRKFLIIAKEDEALKYIKDAVNQNFDKELSSKYTNFLYRNIDDMKSIVQTINLKNEEDNIKKVSLYIDDGQGFSEDNVIQYNYKIDNYKGKVHIFNEIDKKVRRLRLDPIEGKCIIIRNFDIDSNLGKAKYEIVNGYRLEDYIIFDTNDPQISIEIDHAIEWLDITFDISICNYSNSIVFFNSLRNIMVKNIEEKNNIIEVMQEKSKEIQGKSKEIEQKSKEIQQKNEVIRNTNQALDNINKKITDMECSLQYYKNSYNIISTSTCWKITKPIRMLFDVLKKMIGLNRYTLIIYKAIKCLKNNGIKFTCKKIVIKLRKQNGYNKYVNGADLTEKERNRQQKTNFSRDIKFSIVTPLYNTPEEFLHEMIDSCRNQTYSNWELCLADGSDNEHAYVEKIVKSYMKKDKRIKYKKLQKNGGISENTNECIKMSTGDYIALFDHDDVLHPSVLYEYMKAICEKDADFIYCDEDKFEKDINKRFDPYFKPDFAIDNLRANNYICHFTVFKKSLLNQVGLFKKEFDGAQDHDIIFRLVEKSKNIIHVPKVLYHWRVSTASVAADPYAKPYTITAGINAVTEHLKRCGLEAKVESSKFHPNVYRIKYKIIGQPLISILIPNKDHIEELSRCINSILEKSTYKNYEIIIIENNSEKEETFEYYEQLKRYKNIKVVVYKTDGKFNYSAINNFGVNYTNGEHLLFLNNDVEVISENWLEEMLMYSQREDIGAVGAKLYYPNNTIQHAGIILGIGGVAGHSHKYFDRNSCGYFARCVMQQNFSAVTAAALMMKKSIFTHIEGFDESFEVAFNDVDLCMRIRRAGYLIAWTPYAELYHYESISRGYEDTAEKKERFKGEVLRFQKRWTKELENGDPYYNPNLTLEKENFEIG